MKGVNKTFNGPLKAPFKGRLRLGDVAGALILKKLQDAAGRRRAPRGAAPRGLITTGGYRNVMKSKGLFNDGRVALRNSLEIALPY